MTEAAVDALEQNIKLVVEEHRLDRTAFISGLEFMAKAPGELAEELIPEMFTAYVEVERQCPTLGSAAASPPNAPVNEDHAENIERPVGHLRPVLTTAVIVRALLAWPNVTAQNFLDALKKLNLIPEGLDDTIRERIERMLQIRSEHHSHVHIPLSKREGLIFEEFRNRIIDRLSERVLNVLDLENKLQASPRVTFAELGGKGHEMLAPRRRREPDPYIGTPTQVINSGVEEQDRAPRAPAGVSVALHVASCVASPLCQNAEAPAQSYTKSR